MCVRGFVLPYLSQHLILWETTLRLACERVRAAPFIKKRPLDLANNYERMVGRLPLPAATIFSDAPAKE